MRCGICALPGDRCGKVKVGWKELTWPICETCRWCVRFILANRREGEWCSESYAHLAEQRRAARSGTALGGEVATPARAGGAG